MIKEYLKDMRRDLKLIQAIKHSDDYAEHAKPFFDAAKSLIEEGIATVEDFERNGGWVRKSKNWGIYFMFVGEGNHVSQRWYFNVIKREVFQCQM